MLNTKQIKLAVMVGGALLLAGCEDPADLAVFLQAPATATETTVTVIEQEVEAPEIFHVTETGLWDGRPSLGGIWVAHPDTQDPEQVIVRNVANGKFVIGSLFIRERALPGPRLQVSSDAATALEMLAGQPVELTVTALRKREIELAPATVPDGVAEVSVEQEVAASEPAETTEPGSDAPVMRPSTTAEPIVTSSAPVEPAAPTQTTNLEKPYIQIGIFGVEANARNTAESMRIDGIIPTVKEYTANGKTFWRVLVGPAANASERKTLLGKVKSKGFTDAYFVSG